MAQSTADIQAQVKVTDTSFKRDIASKALLQSDPKTVQEYKSRKALIQSLRTKDTEINILRQEMDALTDRLGRLELRVGLTKT